MRIQVGQIWQEIDPRFDAPHKEVRGFAEDGRIIIGSVGRPERTTKAKPERFNNKRSGYRLIQDV